MGFFSNGSEGDFYENAVCARCIHYPDSDDGDLCPVWEIHLLYNYDQKEGSSLHAVLDTLIPRQGVQNGLCKMWHPAKPEWAEHGKEYQEWLEGQKAK